jgi:hypothetical protein
MLRPERVESRISGPGHPVVGRTSVPDGTLERSLHELKLKRKKTSCYARIASLVKTSETDLDNASQEAADYNTKETCDSGRHAPRL